MKAPLGRYAEVVRETTPRSRRVAFIAGYYRFTAAMSAASLAFAVVFSSVGPVSFWSIMRAHPIAFLTWPISIATSWWTGELIGERQRLGAWVAITSIGLGMTSALFAHRPGVSATTIAFGVIGLAAIASVWKELE